MAAPQLGVSGDNGSSDVEATMLLPVKENASSAADRGCQTQS